ncbi:MAG: DUF6508 domain-containing protein [Dehalococcoidia bacterium]
MAALAAATPTARSFERTASLLTICIRHDRFVEGELAGHYRSGLLTRILRRAAAPPRRRRAAAALCEELDAGRSRSLD